MPERATHPAETLGLVLPDAPGLRTQDDGIDPDRLAALVPESVARLVTDGASVWAEAASGAITARFSADDTAAVRTVSDLARHAVTRALFLALTQGRVVSVGGILRAPIDPPAHTRDPRERIQELLAHANAALARRRALTGQLRRTQEVLADQLQRPDLDAPTREALAALWSELFAATAGPPPCPARAEDGAEAPPASGPADWPR